MANFIEMQVPECAHSGHKNLLQLEGSSETKKTLSDSRTTMGQPAPYLINISPPRSGLETQILRIFF